MDSIPSNDPSAVGIPINTNPAPTPPAPIMDPVKPEVPSPAPTNPVPPIYPVPPVVSGPEANQPVTAPPAEPPVANTEPTLAAGLPAEKPVREASGSSAWIIITVVTVLAIAAVLGGVWWYQNNYQTEETSATPSTTPKTSLASPSSSTTTVDSAFSGTSEYIQLNTTPVTKVTFTSPNSWGTVSLPTLSNGVITDGTYRTKAVGASLVPDSSALIKSLVFSSFPFPPAANDLTTGAPSISLMQYPISFSDDTSGTQPLTVADKAAVIAPLETIYTQGSLGSTVAAQTNLSTGKTEKLLKGAWWGNLGTTTDKVAPRYLENKEKTLKGVGFFVNEGLDSTFLPQYRAVLINPSQKLIVQVSIPLSGFTEFAQYLPQSGQTPDATTAKNNVKAAYEYLAKVSAGATEVATSLKNLDGLVSSLSLNGTTTTTSPSASSSASATPSPSTTP